MLSLREKIILACAIILVSLAPLISMGAFTGTWTGTSTSQAWIFPTRINGVDVAAISPYFVATSSTATSTFAGGILGAGNFTVQSSSGRVGIGGALTSVTSDILQVTGNTLITPPSPGQGSVRFGGEDGLSVAAITTYNVSTSLASTFRSIQQYDTFSDLTNAYLQYDGKWYHSRTYALGGTTALPAYSLSNDTNTGLNLLGSDTLDLVTGGVRRLSVTADGNTGIATTSPFAKLSVAPSINQIGFALSTSTASATTTAFIIDTNGKVGIGTSSPSSQLGIAGSWFTTATSTGMNGINLTGGCYAINGTCFTGGGGSGTINSGTTNRLSYYSGATTLDSANFLTVNTATPVLGVASSTPWATLSVGSGSGATNPQFVVASSSAAISTTTDFIVDGFGNTGIGSTSPFLSKLSVTASTTDTNTYKAWTGTNPSATRNNATLSLGYTFTPTIDIKVTHLGRLYAGTGTTQDHTVYIYNSGGTLITSGTVLAAATSEDGIKYLDITDVWLRAGTVYNIVSAETSGGDTWPDLWSATGGFGQFIKQIGFAYGSVGSAPSTFGSGIYNLPTIKFTVEQNPQMKVAHDTSNFFSVYSKGDGSASLVTNNSYKFFGISGLAVGKTNGTAGYSLDVAGGTRIQAGYPQLTLTNGTDAYYWGSGSSGCSSVGSNCTRWGSSYNVINSAGTLYFNLDAGSAVRVENSSFYVSGAVTFAGLTASATGNAVCINGSNVLLNSGGAACVPSSIKYKENIEKLTQGMAIDKLGKLRVVEFDYKEKQKGETNHSYGMIAEEVEKVDKNLIDYKDDGTIFGIHFEKVTGLLVQAVQEIVARLSGLEAKLNAQQKQIDSLQAQINNLKK